MELTERRRSGPSWQKSVGVFLIAIAVGAGGEALVAPAVSTVVTTLEGRASATSGQLRADLAKWTGQSVAASSAVPTAVAPSTPTTATTTASLPATISVPGDDRYIAVVQKAGPSVVTVVNQLGPQTLPFGQVANPQALGSGVIIDPDGHIVTNSHVVAGGSTFQVIFSDGRKESAQLVGRDPISDIAVLKVTGSVPAVATFGDSAQLQPGEEVVAIGSALGDFRNTVTHGIVSGLDRTLNDPNGPGLTGLIQTDAPINHGNSGGPLLNLNGQVIGLNTAVVTSDVTGDVAQGLGFAIPSNTVKQIADELIKNGTVDYPFLGVTYQELNPQIASYYGLGITQGALIQAVQSGSPADTAGLRANDVVTAIDGTQLDDQHGLAGLLMSRHVGDKMSLTVMRDGKPLTIAATLGRRPSSSQ